MDQKALLTRISPVKNTSSVSYKYCQNYLLVLETRGQNLQVIDVQEVRRSTGITG